MKKLLKILGVFIILLVATLLLIPFLFKDKILNLVTQEANKMVNAEISIDDVDLSLLKSFPRATIDIQGLDITGIGQFEGIKLLETNNIEIQTNLVKIIKNQDDIEVLSLVIDEPVIQVQVDKQGNANYDIMKETDDSESSESAIQMSLKQYAIQNGAIHYQDYQSDQTVHIRELNHEGSGDFTSTVFDLKTTSSIKSMDVSMEGIPYLKKAPLSAKMDLGVDLNDSKYTLKENEISLNNVKLQADGFVQMPENGDINLDLALNAPQNSFQNFLSLVPGIFLAQLSNFDISGDGILNGKIKGKYNGDKGVYPSIQFNMEAKNGLIKSADLPAPIENFNSIAKITANQSDWSDLLIDVPSLYFKIKENKTNAQFQLGNVMKDPHISASFDGNLNLTSIHPFLDQNEVEALSGLVKGNFSMDASQSDIENEAYSNIVFNGDIDAEKIDVLYSEYPRININSAHVEASPASLKIMNTSGNIGQSDFDMDANIQNPLAYVMSDKKMSGDVNFKSKTLNIDELYPIDENAINEEVDTSEAIALDQNTSDILRLSNFNYNADIDRIIYQDYDIRNVKSVGSINANNIKIGSSGINLDGAQYDFSGQVENALAYMNNESELNADIQLKADKINLNQYMTEEDATSEEITEALIIPNNMNINITAVIGELLYDKIDLKQIKGVVNIKDGIAVMNDVQSQAFNGQVNFDGKYDSTDPEAPLFDMKYNLSKLSFSDAYSKINTFKILAPIGKFIDGIFNMDFEMNGKLGQDMMPDLNSLTARGFMETVQGIVKGFAPLEKISNQLNISDLKTMNIQDSRNRFYVKDGAVVVDPFDFKKAGMNFEVAGQHFINQDIDYKIDAQIPRKLLKTNVVGQAADKGIGFLENMAKQKGIDISTGEFINLDLGLKGSVIKPKLSVRVVGSSGNSVQDLAKDKIEDIKQQAQDSLERLANKEIDKVKNKAEEKADEVVTEIKTQAQEKVDEVVEEAKDKAEEKAKDVGGEVVDTLAKTVEKELEDKLGKEATDKIDDVKDKLKDINPFKKKKKGN